MSKVQITGASAFVNRMFEACGSFQWAREFLKNSLEAKATRVEFGIEWQAVEKLGTYRRVISDNGEGMSKDELRKFFSTLGDGGKKIGGVHDNFGVGAKIASLPWNPAGVVVISIKDSKASMIQIILDEQTSDYELVDFELNDSKSSVVDPNTVDWTALGEKEIDWSAVKPDWIQEHGTVIVLMGSEAYPDTILGNPHDNSEGTTKGLSVFLNSRFWDLSGCELHVSEVRSDKKNQWPSSASDRDDAKRPNRRRILGAKSYIAYDKSQSSGVIADGAMLIDEDRVAVSWYLWAGDRPKIHMYAQENGFVAVRYKDELYQLSSGKVQFRNFGVVESKVQRNLTIVLEPQHFSSDNGRWGVHPDQSRNRLLFTGDGEKGAELPLHDWGSEFASNMPDEIGEAILAARGENSGSIEDDEYRKRLQDKFGDRWTVKQRVIRVGKTETLAVLDATADKDEVETIVGNDESIQRTAGRRNKNRTTRRLIAKTIPGNTNQGIERDVVVDIPKYRFGNKDDFENAWHIALWNEADNTVVLNPEAPVLTESIGFHQNLYPPVHAEEVQRVVMNVFGEVAVAKVAHSQRLKKIVSDEVLRDEYRNEKALTIALMGLLAEESLISQRLGKLGKKLAA